VLWNGRTFGDRIFQEVIALLKQRYTFEVVQFLKKPYIGNVAPKDYFDKVLASRADVALAGVGD
jgi:hypothetical protein